MCLAKIGRDFEVVLIVTLKIKPVLIVYLNDPISSRPTADAQIFLLINDKNKFEFPKGTKVGVYQATISFKDMSKVTISVKKEHFEEI